MKAPFAPGEMTLAALRRVIRLESPCHGNGTCGRCIVEVLRDDGSLSPQLVCLFPARVMTVRVKRLRLTEQAEHKNS